MKVYILDEVHMASTAAFNALLKLIEEPPGHVLFAMATTDPQKVLPTILSRVQRLDLRRVDASSVAGLVGRIVATEGAAIDDDALEAIVRAGDGSVRDTLSILEQVLALAGAHVTLTHVTQTLGTTPLALVLEVADLIAARDAAGLLTAVQRLSDDGLDLRRFSLDLVGHLRDLLVLRTAPDHPELVDATADRRAALVAQAERTTSESLVRALDQFATAIVDQRLGPPRLPLELALAKTAITTDASDLTSLVERIARLEAGLGAAAPAPLAPAPAAAPATPPPAAPATRAKRAAPAEPPVEPPARTPSAPDDVPAPPAPVLDAAPEVPARAEGQDDLALVVARWPAIIEVVKEISPRARAVFDPATPTALSRGVLVLQYGPRHSNFHAQEASKSALADVLREAVRRACALEVRIEVVRDGEDARRRPQPPLVTPRDAGPPLEESDAAADAAERGGPVAVPAEPAELDSLLRTRLGATRVDDPGSKPPQG